MWPILCSDFSYHNKLPASIKTTYKNTLNWNLIYDIYINCRLFQLLQSVRFCLRNSHAFIRFFYFQITEHKKIKFSIKDFFGKCDQICCSSGRVTQGYRVNLHCVKYAKIRVFSNPYSLILFFMEKYGGSEKIVAILHRVIWSFHKKI